MNLTEFYFKGVGFFLDSSSIGYLVIVVISLLLSAYFASSETAFTAVSRVRLRTMMEKGNKRAKTALWICDRFDKTLSTILIGNNVFHAACASVSTLLVLHAFGADFTAAGTLVTTLVVYLFAEMLPKSLAKTHCEAFALAFAPSMRLLVRVLTPVSTIFTGISNLMARFFASGEQKTVTEEELISIIETIEDEGVLEPEKQALVNSAMEFREKLAEDIMVPMSDVVSVPITMGKKELAELVKDLPYSRIPVYEREKDNVVGILPVSVFLGLYAAKKPVVLRRILLKPYVFDRKTPISNLLQRMRLNKLHMVFLTDDKRKKVGLITMEDLLEELVGDIQDESDAGEGLQLM
jgi:CBS domain containing-hemolysin-like protein